MKKMALIFTLLCGACVQSNGRFGGTVPDGTQPAPAPASAAQSCDAIPEPRFYPSPIPEPPDAPESVPGRDLPVFATEQGGRGLTGAEMGQWNAARAADPAYQEAVKRMQERRAWRASHGALTAFDGGRCTLAQSPEKCREERARMDATASQWLRDSQAARERGEP